MLAPLLSLALSVGAAGFRTSFPAMIERSAAAQPFYASQMLEAVSGHVRTASALSSPSDVRSYVRGAAGVTGKDEAALTAAVQSGTLPPGQAAAVIVGAALQEPEELRRALDELEDVHKGLGRQVASALRGARGKSMAARALRQAADFDPRTNNGLYDMHAQLQAIFDRRLLGRGLLVDGSGPAVPAQDYSGYGPEGRPRPSGLVKGAKVDVSR